MSGRASTSRSHGSTRAHPASPTAAVINRPTAPFIGNCIACYSLAVRSWFGESLLDGSLILRCFAGTKARVGREHVALGIDQVRARHRLHSIMLREVTGWIEAQREFGRHLGEEFVGERAILVEIHSDDLQAVSRVLAMHRVQPRKRSPARHTPRRPE